MTTNKTALVLGISGGIGGEVARRLLSRGWQVRALARSGRPDGSPLGKEPNLTWVKGDALDRAAVMAAAKGASLVVHAVNPPGYRDWEKLVLPMLDNTIAAATAEGARVVLPGTVYNYGPDAFPDIAEDAAQNPVTRKGAIRVEMERRLRAAAERDLRVLIVRAGDFFGPTAKNNWFSQGLVKPGAPIDAITNPGKRGIGHQWAYLPDVAETIVQLAEMEDRLDRFATFHMDGQWDEGGTQMIDAIRRVTGKPALKSRSFPWWAIRLAAPFVPLFKELAEVRYLWRTPARLNNARLLATLGAEPRTSLDEAVRATLAALGVLHEKGTPLAASTGRV